MINIQDISDQTLYRVINEGHDVKWNFFALKVMMTRFRLKLSMSENKEETMQECFIDMRELFCKSSSIPSARNDLQIIVEQFANDT